MNYALISSTGFSPDNNIGHNENRDYLIVTDELTAIKVIQSMIDKRDRKQILLNQTLNLDWEKARVSFVVYDPNDNKNYYNNWYLITLKFSE